MEDNLRISKSLEDAEEAMKMTKQDHLIQSGVSDRDGKKIHQGVKKGGFGATPAFGGAPVFVFGSPPAFGSGNPLGSVFGSQGGAQTANFSSFASANTPTFGSLASQNTEGSGQQQTIPFGGGDSVFGGAPSFGESERQKDDGISKHLQRSFTEMDDLPKTGNDFLIYNTLKNKKMLMGFDSIRREMENLIQTQNDKYSSAPEEKVPKPEVKIEKDECIQERNTPPKEKVPKPEVKIEKDECVQERNTPPKEKVPKPEVKIEKDECVQGRNTPPIFIDPSDWCAGLNYRDMPVLIDLPVTTSYSDDSDDPGHFSFRHEPTADILARLHLPFIKFDVDPLDYRYS